MVLVAGFLLITSFQILLPVVPSLLETRGPHGAAGAATGILFLTMVTAELLTPWLQRRWSAAHLLVVGSLMVGAPCFVYSMSELNSFWLLVATAIRGVGTGVAVVVLVVLITAIAPPNRRGRAIGYFGVAVGLPGIFAPSIGIAMAGNGHGALVAFVAFMAGLLACLLATPLLKKTPSATKVDIDLLRALRQPGLMILIIAFSLVSATYGGLFTYVPVVLPKTGWASSAVFFLTFGTCRALSRGVSGYLGDRYATRWILFVGIALSVAGLVMFAGRAEPVLMILGAGLYGSGNGAAQTGAYLSIALRTNEPDGPLVSSLWNSTMDMGSAVGGATVGLLAAVYSYSFAFWIMPVLACVATALVTVMHRGSEHAIDQLAPGGSDI